MKDEIMLLLTASNMWTHQLCDKLDMPEGEVLLACVGLVQEGKVRRLLDAKWALSMSENNRRRRYGSGAEKNRGSPATKPTTMRCPYPYRPTMKTPDVGFFG